MLEKELRKPIQQWLFTGGFDVVHEVYLCGGYCDIVGCKFTPRYDRKKPFLYYLIAIELKLNDVSGVIGQAKNNLQVANESYAAMHFSRCEKLSKYSLNKFRLAGIGLISVCENVEIIIPAKKNLRLRDNLWRRRIAYSDFINQSLKAPAASERGEME